jgi:hypothetical protein
MMSMPFLILTGLGSYMYLLIRRARGQQAAGFGQEAPTYGEIRPATAHLS